MEDASLDSFGLLSLCAILRWFDADLLRELAPQQDARIAALLASDDVDPAPEFAGAYRLRDARRAAALARLHAEYPQDALALHRRAFDLFLDRMQRPAPPARHPADEVACLHHLGKLFFLLLPNCEWQTMAAFVAAARAAAPQQPRHHQQLAIYEGYLAIRTHDYDRGESILSPFLDHPALDAGLRVHVLNALAQAAWYRTHYDRALTLYQQLYDCAGDAGDRRYQAVALINMGQVYNNIAYYDQALDLSTQAAQIFHELGDAQREAYARYEIGNNAMRMGRWPLALDQLQRAISDYERLGLVANLANMYWCQGFLNHLLGQEALSEAAYLRALAIAQSDQHGDPAVALDIYTQLGFLYDAQGRHAAALPLYDTAADLATSLRRIHRRSLIHYQRGHALAQLGRPADADDAYTQAIHDAESLRGDMHDERIKIGLLGTTQQLYETVVLRRMDQGRPAEAFGYVEQARSRAFLDTLAHKHPDLYAALDQPVATLAEVQRALDPGALLIEYFTTGVIPRGEHVLNKLPPENARLRARLTVAPQILIFAVTRDTLTVHRARLDPNLLQPQPGDPEPGRRLLHARLLIQLYQELIAPVRPLLDDCTQLYLIPHGPLHYVPFMALRDAAGAHLLDRDGPAIALAPSATILLRNCLGRPRSAARGRLALGYNDEGDRALRYAETEARHVARLLGGEAWTGSEPKIARLRAAGPGLRWLHIAGHAIYHPRDPYRSELRLEADGALTAHTIMAELDLAVDGVTLSGCTTGVTHVVPGDELLGLPRAFLYAGAPAVVCTLWETADFVALLVMDRFYTALRGGHAAAAALRDAQAALRSMTGRELMATIAGWRATDPAFVDDLGELPVIPDEHLEGLPFAEPFYWAPFMLIGRPS